MWGKPTDPVGTVDDERFASREWTEQMMAEHQERHRQWIEDAERRRAERRAERAARGESEDEDEGQPSPRKLERMLSRGMLDDPMLEEAMLGDKDLGEARFAAHQKMRERLEKEHKLGKRGRRRRHPDESEDRDL